MKKNLNFGLFLGLVMFFLALGACSGGDSDGGGAIGGGSAPVVNGKRLVKVRIEGNSYDIGRSNAFADSVVIYEYNSKGQIVSLKRREGGNRSSIIYTDSMIATDSYGHDYFILKNGRVVRDSPSSSKNLLYEYDGAGQLTTIKSSSSPSSLPTEITWQNGNITKVGGWTFNYTSHPNTVPMMLCPIGMYGSFYNRDQIVEALWGQGFFGKVCQNLPAGYAFTETDSSGQTRTTITATFDYTFKDGVPTVIIEQVIGGYNSGTHIWQLTWE